MPLTKFQAEVATVSLKKMLNGGHFSICEIDRIGEMAGVSPKQHQDYKTLSALHCVSWGDMPPGLAAEVKHKTIDMLKTMLENEVEVVLSYRGQSEASAITADLESAVSPPKGLMAYLPWRKK